MKIKKFNGVKDKYLYVSPFTEEGIYYICNECYSNKLRMIKKGGFQTPSYECDNCGSTVYAPMNLTPNRYKEYLIDKIIRNKTKKFNI